MSEFNRENRYIVIKRKDLNTIPFAALQSFLEHLGALTSFLPRREFVVVESDWPEYETVLAMLAARVEGRPTPYQVLEQQAAALRQHKNDYMEAAEGTRRALEAEAKALREEVAALRAERKELTEARLERDELRARVVVDEDGAFDEWWEDSGFHKFRETAVAAWEARARLNGKAVSEGLLRLCAQMLDFYADHLVDASAEPEDIALAYGARDELRALLGEGKEVGGAQADSRTKG